MALIMTLSNFIALRQRRTRKALQKLFTTFSILVFQGDPLSQSSPILALMYSKTPLLTSQISSRSENPFARYLLLNFVHFGERLMHGAAWYHRNPDQSSPNSGSMWPLARPLNMPNFVALHQTVYEKSGTKIFYTRHYFGALGDPLGQSSPIWVVIYNKLPNFVPFWKPLYEIGLSAEKVRRFC